MKIKVQIPQNQIHHYVEDDKDILQFDAVFPDYPDLPTYGLMMEAPFSKEKLIDTVKAKALEVKEQAARDTAVRTLLTDDIKIFEVDV